MNIERLQMSIQTVKDNIKILESQEPEDAGYYLQLEHEKIVLDALEKQVPKRPLTKSIANDGYAWEWVCPNCHIVKVTTEKQFCGDCGQKLDWSAHPTEKGSGEE